VLTTLLACLDMNKLHQFRLARPPITDGKYGPATTIERQALSIQVLMSDALA
jgi:hypothetical protein